MSALPNPPSARDVRVAEESGLNVRRYEIELDPERALRDVETAYANFYRERMRPPDALVLGVETYWSLCRASEGTPSTWLSQMPQLTGWREAELFVDDEIRWRARPLALPKHAHHWRCGLETTDE